MYDIFVFSHGFLIPFYENGVSIQLELPWDTKNTMGE
jgi:hypothetical protein